MALISIEFTTDNAAFEDNPFEEMKYVYEQCLDAYRTGRNTPVATRSLFDSNGNKIGHLISEK